MLLAESSHRHPALLLLCNQLPPPLAPFFLGPRHAASIDHPRRFAKWCSSDAYDIVKILMDHGANPEAVDSLTGKNALQWCQDGVAHKRGDETSDFPLALSMLRGTH